MDVDTIATALLHDTLEDTFATPEELERLFGKEVLELVQGVTKISKLEFRSITSVKSLGIVTVQ